MTQDNIIINKNMAKFLDKNISPEDLAKHLRRFKYEVIKMVLVAETDTFCREWIADGHYFITELCEILDPQLLDEEK